MRFPQGAHFNRIKVAAQSFEENNLGHPAFARLCHRIGEILTTNLPSAPTRRPLYLSKHKATHGVSRILNEEDLMRDLELLGVDILCPETLSLKRQIQIWRDGT